MKWKRVPGFTRYAVSDAGAVRRVERVYTAMSGKCAQIANNSGYSCVNMTSDDGRHCKVPVHTLVMLAFVGPRSPDLMVCHNDGVKTNNRISNLRYGTAASNSADAILHGALPRGERHKHAKLTNAQAREVHARCAKNESHADIAAEFGITSTAVCNIARRKSWRCLGLPKLKHVRCLSDSNVLEAAKLVASGMSKSEAGRRFGASPQAIHDALKRRLPRLFRLRHPDRANLFELRAMPGNDRGTAA